MEERDPTKEDWSEVYGQKFTPAELKDARDFHDLATSYCMDNEFLMAYLTERKPRVGHRLYLAMRLDYEQLGIICFKDDDDRIVIVAKERSAEMEREQGGRSSIILPGDAPTALAAPVAQREKKTKPKIIIP